MKAINIFTNTYIKNYLYYNDDCVFYEYHNLKDLMFELSNSNIVRRDLS